MKKNIIIIISIVVILAAVVAVIITMNKPEIKKNKVKEATSTNIVNNIDNDLQAIDFGNSDKAFETVDKDIQSL